jgi:hypothetical protein
VGEAGTQNKLEHWAFNRKTSTFFFPEEWRKDERVNKESTLVPSI